MARIPNPYIVGTPIPDPDYFYGRQSLLNFVRDTLNPPQQRVVVLYGQRRIGKTSVLYELARRLSDEYHPVYFDLMGQANRPLPQALHELANTIGDSLDFDPPDSFDDPRQFREFLSAMADLLPEGKPLLLLLDEFDDLSEDEARADAAAHTLFEYLRDLLNIQLPIVFVFVVGRRLTELPQNFQSILKQAPSRRVAFLREDDAKELITKPAGEHLHFADTAVQAIYDLTSGHPYFTQLICFELFRLGMSRDTKQVGARDVTAVLDSALETGKGGLAWFWDALPLAERFVMSAIAEISGPHNTASIDDVRQLLSRYDLRFLGMEITDAPNLLVQWEILHETPTGYHFAVDLVRRWILVEHPLSQSKREIENLVPRANRYFANAREAHQAGDMREAIGDYQRALQANPNHLRAQLGLAQALTEQGDTREAHDAYKRAYEMDQASAGDSLARSYDNFAAQEEQKRNWREAIIKLERAQEVAYTEARQKRVEELTAVAQAQEARQEKMIRRLGYGVASLVLIALITYAIVQSGIFDPNEGDITAVSPADDGEALVLVARINDTGFEDFSAEEIFADTWQNAFDDMRVELVPNIIENEEQAVNLAESLNAHAVIGAESWMTSDSLQIAVTLVGERDALLFSFDIDGVYSHPREVALTQSDFEQYAEKMVMEASDWGLDKIIRQLSEAEDPETGTVADVPGDFLLAQLILKMTQVFPVEVPDYTRLADNIVVALAEQGYFAPLLFADKFGLPIAFVPSGTFTMGRNAAEAEELCLAYSNACNVDFFASEPPIEVLVDKFFIDAYEVSNWAYQQCVDIAVCPPPDSFDSETKGDYFFDEAFADYPVVNVPWEYAMIYCEWRNGRLPSEAEWEKAARWFPAHGSQTYPWSHNFDDDTPTPALANYELTPGDTVAVYEYEEGRSPVGTLNQAGNVWEWVADWFDPDYYAVNSNSTNPAGPENGELKVIRGGSFGNAFASGQTEIVDPARRIGHAPFGNQVTGFRCAYDTLEYSNQ